MAHIRKIMSESINKRFEQYKYYITEVITIQTPKFEKQQELIQIIQSTASEVYFKLRTNCI